MHHAANLARKRRPRTFKEVVGQSFTIRMLQNGLFLEKIFPAYLFAGQRGCGKTSTARVFASALNCLQINNFRKAPKDNVIPCLECDSCKSMLRGNHPDFTEVDAASNTGVDNIRQILEASSYLPLIGKKKIYLIDEAHMLSRAAFNALLKILEEPPESVLFMLATTEFNKIPNTVRSRCFYAPFRSVQANEQVEHLKTLCASENITVADSALQVIAQQSGGSIRDGMNMLEQLTSLKEELNADSVRTALGLVSPKDLIALFSYIANKDVEGLLTALTAFGSVTLDTQSLWNGIGDLLLAMTRAQFSVDLSAHSPFVGCESDCASLAKTCSAVRVYALTQLFWGQEEVFQRTSNKKAFLEHLLVQMALQVDIASLETLAEQFESPTPNEEREQVVRQPARRQASFVAPAPVKAIQEPVETKINASQKREPSVCQQAFGAAWSSFVAEKTLCSDKLLASIMSQAVGIEENVEKKELVISVPKINMFLTEKISSSNNVWQPLLQRYFPQASTIVLKEDSTKPAQNILAKPQTQATVEASSSESIDLSDKERWPTANLLTQKIPGRVEITTKKEQ
ncbi:DNA polymerase III subunit gamma/tau [Candidatus Babeliales bacterium]|nr:DNA polymerase III subunit gamma/tau [Candidatus Babeliales bacterium]